MEAAKTHCVADLSGLHKPVWKPTPCGKVRGVEPLLRIGRNATKLLGPPTSLQEASIINITEIKMIDMQSSINPDDEQIERVGKVIHAATMVTPSRREICNIMRAIMVTRPPLTPVELKVFEALQAHYAEERHAITMRGLQARAGNGSLGHTHKVVKELCEKGYAIQLCGKYLPVKDIGLNEP